MYVNATFTIELRGETTAGVMLVAAEATVATQALFSHGTCAIYNEQLWRFTTRNS